MEQQGLQVYRRPKHCILIFVLHSVGLFGLFFLGKVMIVVMAVLGMTSLVSLRQCYTPFHRIKCRWNLFDSKILPTWYSNLQCYLWEIIDNGTSFRNVQNQIYLFCLFFSSFHLNSILYSFKTLRIYRKYYEFNLVCICFIDFNYETLIVISEVNQPNGKVVFSSIRTKFSTVR